MRSDLKVTEALNFGALTQATKASRLYYKGITTASVGVTNIVAFSTARSVA